MSGLDAVPWCVRTVHFCAPELRVNLENDVLTAVIAMIYQGR